MHQLAAKEAADDITAALAQRADAERRRGRSADEVECARDSLQLLQRVERARVDAAFRAELRGGGELRVIHVACNDALHALLAQDGDADQPEPAAAEHR